MKNNHSPIEFTDKVAWRGDHGNRNIASRHRHRVELVLQHCEIHDAENQAVAEILGIRYAFAMSETAEMPATELGSMIVRTPGIIGGKPHIRGHRVGVHRVAGWGEMGLWIEGVGGGVFPLSSAENFGGLAYYHFYKGGIDAYILKERPLWRPFGG